MYKVVYFDRNSDGSQRFMNFSQNFDCIGDAQVFLSDVLKYCIYGFIVMIPSYHSDVYTIVL